jgi:hypothetical protein
VQQDPVMMRIMANNPVVRQILQPHGEQSVATTKGNVSADTVGQESIQLKCASCSASDSVQIPESESQKDNSSSEPKEVQKAANGEKSSESKIQQVAATGFRGSATSLPHLNQIQQSFGVDLSGVQAYVGGDAAAACQRMGAAAYASGNQIAFKEQPSLELAAHEAAHIVQQRSGKVQLAGGVGQVGDKYENHADTVAAKVAAGESAAPLLAEYAKPNQITEQEKSSETADKSCQMDAKEPSSGDNELRDSFPAKENLATNYERVVDQNQPATDLSKQHQPELMALKGLPPLPSVIPQSVLRRVGNRVSQKVLWRRFWQVVIQRFALRGAAAAGLSVADGPFPVGDLIALGIAIWTLWDLFRLWDELWNQVPTEPQQEPESSPALKPRPQRPSQSSNQSEPERENQGNRRPSSNENLCATKYPGLRLCDELRERILQRYQHYNRAYQYLAVGGRGPFGRYIYGSKEAALRVVKQVNGYPNPDPFYIDTKGSEVSDAGVCPGEGEHLAVRDQRRDNRGEESYLASILSCPCCEQPGREISLYALGPHDIMFPPRRRADLSTPADEQVAIRN